MSASAVRAACSPRLSLSLKRLACPETVLPPRTQGVSARCSAQHARRIATTSCAHRSILLSPRAPPYPSPAQASTTLRSGVPLRALSASAPRRAALSLASTSSATPPPPAPASPAAPGVPAQRAEIAYAPSAQDLEDAEVDAAPVPPADVVVGLTDRAAEQLRAISQREGDGGAALRISVESGGCHGYQYKMDLASTRDAAGEDYVLAHPAIRPSNLLIDAVSLPLVNGSTVDYATELIGSSFRVVANPNATGKGCGCGVSWELKV